MVLNVARAAAKTTPRRIKTIKDFEAAYVPKGIQLQGAESSPRQQAMPDLVSDALRSLRRSLR